MNHKNQYRNDFPLLTKNPLVYLGSVTTTQKPSCVIQAECDFYERYNANPMRGFCALSLEVTGRLGKVGDRVRRFVSASSVDEIIFTRNTTESLDLTVYNYGLFHLKAGDRILVSVMERRNNLLP